MVPEALDALDQGVSSALGISDLVVVGAELAIGFSRLEKVVNDLQELVHDRHQGPLDAEPRLEPTSALLQVLEKPYLPLTSNPAELAARRRVRKRLCQFRRPQSRRDSCLGCVHTLIGTATLLGVNVLHFFQGSPQYSEKTAR